MGNASFVCTYINPCNTLCDKKQLFCNNTEWEPPIVVENSQRLGNIDENELSKKSPKKIIKESTGRNSFFEIDLLHKNNRGSFLNSNINTNTFSGINSNFQTTKINSINNNINSNIIIVSKNNNNQNVSSFNSTTKRNSENQNDFKNFEEPQNLKNISTIKENENKSLEEEEEDDENNKKENKELLEISPNINPTQSKEEEEKDIDTSNNPTNLNNNKITVLDIAATKADTIKDKEKDNNNTLNLPIGDKYEGEIQDQKPHGKGKYISSDGKIREGIFEKGLLKGEGKITLPDNSEYTGYFINDKLCGKGKYILSNKEIYLNTNNADSLQNLQTARRICLCSPFPQVLSNLQS